MLHFNSSHSLVCKAFVITKPPIDPDVFIMDNTTSPLIKIQVYISINLSRVNMRITHTECNERGSR